MLYKRKGSRVYHSRRDCSQVPGNVYQDPYWMTLSVYASPSGELCGECVERYMQDSQRGSEVGLKRGLVSKISGPTPKRTQVRPNRRFGRG